MSDGKGNRGAEIEIFNAFSRIVKQKFASLADEAEKDGGAMLNQYDVLYKQPEFSAEKRTLNDMNQTGLSKGVMSGLACFAFLRFSPRYITRFLQRRAGITAPPEGRGTAVNNPFNKSSSGGYKLDPIPGQQQQQQQQPGIFFRVIRLGLDTFVSLSIGAYASLYFVDKERMMKQFEDIPLVEGRSLISEQLCEDFTKEFQRFDPKTWDRNHPSLTGGTFANESKDGGHDFRNTMQGFIANCRRRAIYEDELIKERGLTSNEPPVIPSSGVPRDIPVTLDDLIGEQEFGDGGNDDDMHDGDDYFDRYFDMDDEKKD